MQTIGLNPAWPSRQGRADCSFLDQRAYQFPAPQLVTDFGLSGSFCQVQNGPPSSKAECLKKRKPALTLSTLGRLYQASMPKTSCVSCC